VYLIAAKRTNDFIFLKKNDIFDNLQNQRISPLKINFLHQKTTSFLTYTLY